MSNIKFFRVNGSAQEFSREEMKEAFDAVQDKQNWKNPIPVQPIDHLKLTLTVQAIAYFAGSPTDIGQADDGTIYIKAPGYYACIGA